MARPVPRPTSRGLAASATFVLVVAVAGTSGTPELAPLAVVVGVPLALGPWLAHRRARRCLEAVELHSHVEPGTVEVGDEMRVRLSLTHRPAVRSPVPTLGLPATERHWRARRPGTVGPASRARLAPSSPSLSVLPNPGPGRTGSCWLPVPSDRRGVFELPPQQTWALDPFGLFGAPGPATPVATAVVCPRPDRPDQPVDRVAAVMGGMERIGHSSSGRGLGELEGIRPYVAGDRLSLLHWPAKARYGSWFVRQFADEGAAALSIAFDDRAGVHRRTEFERLVSVTSSILSEAAGRGRAVRLLTLTGREYSFEPSDRGRADVRLALAEIQPADTRSSGRRPTIPNGTSVLTTRTGADRLTSSGAGAETVDLADGGAVRLVSAPRVVVP